MELPAAELLFNDNPILTLTEQLQGTVVIHQGRVVANSYQSKSDLADGTNRTQLASLVLNKDGYLSYQGRKLRERLLDQLDKQFDHIADGLEKNKAVLHYIDQALSNINTIDPSIRMELEAILLSARRSTDRNLKKISEIYHAGGIVTNKAIYLPVETTEQGNHYLVLDPDGQVYFYPKQFDINQLALWKSLQDELNRISTTIQFEIPSVIEDPITAEIQLELQARPYSPSLMLFIAMLIATIGLTGLAHLNFGQMDNHVIPVLPTTPAIITTPTVEPENYDETEVIDEALALRIPSPDITNPYQINRLAANSLQPFNDIYESEHIVIASSSLYGTVEMGPEIIHGDEVNLADVDFAEWGAAPEFNISGTVGNLDLVATLPSHVSYPDLSNVDLSEFSEPQPLEQTLPEIAVSITDQAAFLPDLLTNPQTVIESQTITDNQNINSENLLNQSEFISTVEVETPPALEVTIRAGSTLSEAIYEASLTNSQYAQSIAAIINNSDGPTRHRITSMFVKRYGQQWRLPATITPEQVLILINTSNIGSVSLADTLAQAFVRFENIDQHQIQPGTVFSLNS